jgi:mannose-6-phosphate isomerase-like protein (cupin superfamily)
VAAMKFDLNKISRKLKKSWHPVTIAKIDNFALNIAKFKGKYHWHKHDKDELFIVLKGRIKILTEKENIILNQGEGIKIPKNTDHCPVAITPSIVLMFEDSKLKNIKINKTL